MTSLLDAFHVRDAVSGATGAACLVAAGAPFDTVKLRIQMGVFNGPIAAFRQMIRNEGLLSLWKGAGTAFNSAVIENTVIFSVNGLLRRLHLAERPEGHEETIVEHLLTGAITGIFSSTAICPAEVVKVRMQYLRNNVVDSEVHFRDGWQCMMHIIRNEGGVRGLFAGLSPLMARDIPFNAIFFTSYRMTSTVYRKWVGLAPGDAMPSIATFLAGGTAGVAAWTLVFPADVLKSRMQVAHSPAAGVGPLIARNSCKPTFMSTLRGVLQENGVRGLYRGWSAAVMRSFPANAALFWGVETADRLMRDAGI